MSVASSWARRLLPPIVSVVALAILFQRVDLVEIGRTLSWGIAAVMLPALLAYGAVTLLLDATCLRLLLHPPPPGFDAWTAARIKSASYLLAIVNYLLGVAALTVLLRRRAGISLAEATSAVLVISYVDLFVVLVLASAGGALVEQVPRALGVTGLLGVAAVSLGGLAVLRSRGSLGPLERVRQLAIFDALRRVPGARLLTLLGLRVLFSGAFIGLSAAAFYSFDLAPPAPLLVAGSMAVALVGAIPIAVAGIGTVNAAVVEIFRGVGSPEALLALSLVFSAGMIALRVAIGLLFAREFTREALGETRAPRPVEAGEDFTGERLHAGDPLFAVDLARHRAAYEAARARLAPEPALDVGSGSGYGTAALAGPAQPMIGLDRARPDPENRRGAGRFARGDVSRLPFRDAAFGTVVSFQVIEHLEDPSRYLDEMARTLRPGGVALLTTPNRLRSDGLNPYHVHEYVADELASLLRAHFDEVEMLGVGTSERVSAHLEARSRRARRIVALDPLRLRERLPRSFVEWLFGRLARVVRRTAGRGEEIPDVGAADFPIGPASEDCLDLLAVCRRRP